MKQVNDEMNDSRSVLGVICSSYDSFFGMRSKKIAELHDGAQGRGGGYDGGRAGKGPAIPVMPRCPGSAAGAALRDFTAEAGSGNERCWRRSMEIRRSQMISAGMTWPSH